MDELDYGHEAQEAAKRGSTTTAIVARDGWSKPKQAKDLLVFLRPQFT